MKILMNPTEIIRRCLWANYRKFVLKGKSTEEVNTIINKNEPEVIREQDAYVIGLLKFIETENLVHRFKLEMEEILKIKSTINKIEEKDKVVINKGVLLRDIIEFKNRFPDAYKPNDVYKVSIEELLKFINELYEKVNTIRSYTIVIKEKNFTFVLSQDIKKLLK